MSTVLSIAVRPSSDTGDHEVCLFGDGDNLIDVFSDGMIGLDPDDILVEPCPLLATTEARTVTIGRCDCGVVGCGSVEVVVQRSSAIVSWRSVRSAAEVCFDAADYDAEVLRALNDHDWEPPDRTVARLVRGAVDRDKLRSIGLEYSWASGRGRSNAMTVALILSPGPYQLIVHAPFRDETPRQAADRIVELLALGPSNWDQVDWFPQTTGLAAPPIAGPGWRRGTS